MKESHHLDARGKGESDYDYKNDILFFKIKNREYVNSIDFDDILIDIDKEGYMTGTQIFDASKLFGMDKETLRNIKQWEFNMRAEDKVITIQLKFVSIRRNKIMVEHGQNLVRETQSNIRDTEVLCTVLA